MKYPILVNQSTITLTLVHLLASISLIMKSTEMDNQATTECSRAVVDRTSCGVKFYPADKGYSSEHIPLSSRPFLVSKTIFAGVQLFYNIPSGWQHSCHEWS